MNTPSCRKPFAAFLILVFGSTLAFAADAPNAAPSLTVGSPAPRLETGKWIQGEPVKGFENGKSYLVEFWATWCGPCRFSIPHLNEIHTRFRDKGLVVIGQDVWEQDESLVEPFVKKMGGKMTYRVALDDKSTKEKGAMAAAWMEAAGASGIPTAFLVDTKGRIAWIGHPMELQDETIEDVVTGKFDVARAAAEYQTRRKNEEALDSAYRQTLRAMKEKDWDTALTRLAEAEKLMPDSQKDALVVTRFGILVGKKDFAAAHRLAGDVSDRNKNDVMLQNELAWQILTAPGIEKRDLALAEKIATRATEASKGEDSAVLDTLARALFLRDKKTEAIALQEKAVKLVEDDSPQKKTMQATLDSYKAGKVPTNE